MSSEQRSPITLITGGSRGLGRSMAIHLAERGGDVLITYRNKEKEAAEVVKEVQARGRRAAKLPLEVGDSKSFAAFAEAVRTTLSREFQAERLDHLVNNAGGALYAPITETTEAQLDEVYAVHFKAPYLLTQRLLPLLADGGKILNVSSGLARFSMPGSSAYAAMKGAVEVLTRYQALELAPRRITVNTLAPGAIATDFGGGHVRDNPELSKRVAGMTALGRVGQADDIGKLTALLLSADAGWVTGQRIEASGGTLL
jgi:NAD(P)-dependent dehydrogenase (short-subunit alcohol dehydrogenase family)